MGIQIPEPCTQKWGEMTPTEKGAFCQKCALEVIDYTGKTPLEIKSSLTEKFALGTRVCGRIRQSQMTQLNDIDFRWNSDKDHFQTVWIFSLLAVFGLTLFSCQNTASKELVEQMNVEAQHITDQDASDTSEITEEQEVAEVQKEDSITGKTKGEPYDPIGFFEGEILSGTPFETEILKEIDVCTILMGDISVTYGMFTPEDAAPTSINRAFFPIKTSPQPNGDNNIQPFRPVNYGKKSTDIIFNEDLDDFVAYIAPVPISSESKLYLQVSRSIELYLGIVDLVTNEFISENERTFERGNHRYSIPFEQLNSGNYQLNLQSENTAQTIRFDL